MAERKFADTLQVVGAEKLLIGRAQSFDDLLEIVGNIPMISETEAQKWNELQYDSTQLRKFVTDVRDGRINPDQTPKAFGLQDALKNLAFLYKPTPRLNISEHLLAESAPTEPTRRLGKRDDFAKTVEIERPPKKD